MSFCGKLGSDSKLNEYDSFKVRHIDMSKSVERK